LFPIQGEQIVDTLTFVLEKTDEPHVKLVPSQDTISDAMWEEFAHNITRESGLRPTPAETLVGRWQRGEGAAVIQDGHIVGHASIVEIYCETNRRKFGAALGIATALLPDIDVWKLATSWTAPQWRRRHIQMQLTKILQGQCAQKSLFTAVAIGLAGSPAIAKFGWHIIGWSTVPFASSLIGIPISGHEDRVEVRWWPPPDVVRYEGPHLFPLDNTGHDWAHFGHLWVSSTPIAKELDQRLRTVLNNNLDRWRHASITVFTGTPQSLLNFFRE
jgi:hypothetical protein